MAEDKDTPKVTKVATEAPISNADLLALVIQTQQQLAAAMKEQSDAIRESRIPYVDPQVLEQKRLALEERKADVRRELNKRIQTKKQCLHLRTTSDGHWVEGKLNIKWQEHSQGIVKGVCGTCFSEFDSRNPEDMKLLRLDGVAIRNMGRSRENQRLG